MAALIDDVVQFLVDEGIVEGFGIDTFAEEAPDSPSDVTVIYEYSGSPAPLHEMNILHRSLQITVRGTSHTTSKEKAWEIYKALQKPDRFVQLTPDRFAQVYLRQSPFKLYVDTKQRKVYGFNLGITTKPD